MVPAGITTGLGGSGGGVGGGAGVIAGAGWLSATGGVETLLSVELAAGGLSLLQAVKNISPKNRQGRMRVCVMGIRNH
jgi:hypothetical protein